MYITTNIPVYYAPLLIGYLTVLKIFYSFVYKTFEKNPIDYRVISPSDRFVCGFISLLSLVLLVYIPVGIFSYTSQLEWL